MKDKINTFLMDKIKNDVGYNTIFEQLMTTERMGEFMKNDIYASFNPKTYGWIDETIDMRYYSSSIEKDMHLMMRELLEKSMYEFESVKDIDLEYDFDIVIPQIKSIMLPEYVSTIAHGLKLDIHGKVEKMLDKLKDTYQTEKEYTDYTIELNSNVMNSIYKMSESKELDKFVSCDMFEQCKVKEISRLLFSYYVNAPKIKDSILEKNISKEYSLCINNFDVSFALELNDTKSYFKVAKSIEIELPEEYPKDMQDCNGGNGYIDLDTQTMYIMQFTKISGTIKNDEDLEFFNNLKTYSNYMTHLFQLIQLSLYYKTDNGYFINDSGKGLLKYLTDITDTGFKIKFDNKDASLDFNETKNKTILKIGKK